MHVSRGISSQLPIRLNCRPELVKLVLRCPQPAHPSAADHSERELAILEQAIEMGPQVKPTADTGPDRREVAPCRASRRRRLAARCRPKKLRIQLSPIRLIVRQIIPSLLRTS